MTNQVDEKFLISEGLAKIFAHRSSFIVIGLTGRTGSGCTTVAEILGNEKFDTVELTDLPNPPKTNEDRKDRIIREWLKENWHPFNKVQVSQVIQLLAASDKSITFENFLEKNFPEVNIKKIEAILSPHKESFLEANSTL